MVTFKFIIVFQENLDFVPSAALKTVVVLFPLLGLCWLFGLMAILTQSRAFLYPFAVLSPLQVCDTQHSLWFKFNYVRPCIVPTNNNY